MRLVPVDRNNLTTAQADVLHQIESGPRSSSPGIGTQGPFSAFVKAPKIGGAAQALGAAIRYGGSLPNNVKEVAICTVGVFYRARFEFVVHKAMAVKAGVAEIQLRRMAAGDTPEFEGIEQLAFEITSQMLEDHVVEDHSYAAGVSAFGEEGMIELVLTVGYYCLICHTLNTFQVPLEPGMEDPFLQKT
jgi:4-carboxymuconolactone decarboxylase